jgi:hypothetical protein
MKRTFEILDNKYFQKSDKYDSNFVQSKPIWIEI